MLGLYSRAPSAQYKTVILKAGYMIRDGITGPVYLYAHRYPQGPSSTLAKTFSEILLYVVVSRKGES